MQKSEFCDQVTEARGQLRDKDEGQSTELGGSGDVCTFRTEGEEKQSAQRNATLFFLSYQLPPFFTTVSALDKNLEKTTV